MNRGKKRKSKKKVERVVYGRCSQRTADGRPCKITAIFAKNGRCARHQERKLKKWARSGKGLPLKVVDSARALTSSASPAAASKSSSASQVRRDADFMADLLSSGGRPRAKEGYAPSRTSVAQSRKKDVNAPLPIWNLADLLRGRESHAKKHATATELGSQITSSGKQPDEKPEGKEHPAEAVDSGARALDSIPVSKMWWLVPGSEAHKAAMRAEDRREGRLRLSPYEARSPDTHLVEPKQYPD